MPEHEEKKGCDDNKKKCGSHLKEAQANKEGKNDSSLPKDVQSRKHFKETISTHDETYGRNATLPILAVDRYKKVVLPDLLEFNPDDIKLDATIVAVGKRRTGKSWIFRNLMYILKDKIPAGIVISQTDELNHFWQQYIPKRYIHNRYEPEILEAVFQRQKKILNDKNKTDKEKEEEAPFFVLLDDVISDHRLKYDDKLVELFVAGRHYKLFVLITTQYAKAITPTLRGNTDFCFMLKCVQQRQREALWEDFADFLTKEAFNQILDVYTEDNECIVINTCPDCKVDPMSMMFWWKAVDPGQFLMGSKAYWQSAANSNPVPNAPLPRSTGEMITTKDIMPYPWNETV